MKPKSSTAACLLVVSACACAAGCSDKARITRHDGWEIEAEITRSTDAFIYAQPEGAPEVEIARRDIRDLDHPGNVMGVIGLSIMGAYSLNVGLGAYFLTSSSDPYNQQIGAIQLFAGGIGMLIGAGFAYWGWSIWDRSVAAAGGEDDWPSVQLTPSLMGDGRGNASPGASFRLVF
jgi:hypothetical protein